MKRAQLRKANGQFRKTTLRDFGFIDSDFSNGDLKKCEKCGEKSRPILKQWKCACGHKNESED